MFGVGFELHRRFDMEGMRCKKNAAFYCVWVIGSCREVRVTCFWRCLCLEGFVVCYEMQVSLFRKEVPQVQTTGPKQTLTPGVTGACCDTLWVTGALPQRVRVGMGDSQGCLGRSRVG